MKQLAMYINWISAIESILTVALLVTLVRRSLARVYFAFFLYLCSDLVVKMVFLGLPNGNRYAVLYFLTSPVLWLFSILIIYELYANILSGYPGILSAGRWVIGGTFLIAVLLAFASAGFDWNLEGQSYPWIYFYTYAARWIKTALVFFLFGMTIFLRWFPAPLDRNVHVHSVVLFLYFLIPTASLLVHNLKGANYTPIVNVIIGFGSCLCLLGWLLQLSPTQQRKLVTYHNMPIDEEARILSSLESINETLVGVGRDKTKRNG